MIDLLNTGNIYPVKELSEKIGVTERMIRYYKEEISSNGIMIESFKGPNGGYFMLDKIKNYTNINEYDLQLLDNIYNILEKSQFKDLEKYKEFMEKVKNMYSVIDEKSKYIFHIKRESFDKIEKKIISAMEKQEKIEIIYNNLDGTKSQRVIHPIQLFQYKDSCFCYGFL